jgi:hypothetical protein
MKAAFGTPAQVLVVVLVMIITFLTPVVSGPLLMNNRQRGRMTDV